MSRNQYTTFHRHQCIIMVPLIILMVVATHIQSTDPWSIPSTDLVGDRETSRKGGFFINTFVSHRKRRIKVPDNKNIFTDLENLFDGQDFGFNAVNEDELKEMTGSKQTEELISNTAKSEDIQRLEAKLDEMLNNKSTANDCAEVLRGKMKQIENLIFPLLVNLKKNADKDYIYWPNRTPIIDQQIQRILGVTRF